MAYLKARSMCLKKLEKTTNPLRMTEEAGEKD
jgi:hypothetical protein